ncbi:MAG: hypothetical protein KC912_12075 [Proteobacteria bacterium]|nr:hypothetical protein [Pseudomonadota bacterium]
MRHLISLLLLTACGENLGQLPNRPGGNPVAPDIALFPYPADLYVSDGRVAFEPDGLPDEMTPELFADGDGFSRITPILTWLDGGFDKDSLPDPTDGGATIADGAPIWLIDALTGERVPHLAELDGYADAPEEATLIIRPLRVLEPSTPHVVLLRSALLRADGSAHTPTEAFRALRDGIRTDTDEVEAQREDYEIVNEAIAGEGLDPEDVYSAWMFTTASREHVTGPSHRLAAIMDEAELGTATLEAPVRSGPNDLIIGSFTAPNFLDDDSRIQVDADGEPIQQGTAEVAFAVTVPDSVTETRPVIAFGHGFFSSIEEPTWSAAQAGLQPWAMSAVATDFLGFNEASQLSSAGVLAGDFARLPEIVDQQRQSQANFTAMARVVREQLASTLTVDKGDGSFLPLDASNMPYAGASNGGTQGLVIMATSSQFDRGCAVVPGGGWSHMMQRAVQWNTLGGIMRDKYPNEHEMQLALALSQQLFDSVDSMNYMDALVENRVDGRTDVKIQLHEAVGDTQVSNFVSEILARTIDMPLVGPSPREIWGLEEVIIDAPRTDMNTALYVYDEGHDPLPLDNVAPAEENGTHDGVRKLQSYIDHVGPFLEDGSYVYACEGSCDPN